MMNDETVLKIWAVAMGLLLVLFLWWAWILPERLDNFDDMLKRYARPAPRWGP